MARLQDLITRLILTDSISKEIDKRVESVVTKRESEATALRKLSEPLSPFLATPLDSINQQRRGAKKSSSGVPFAALREFSRLHWATRACIQKRQEQIAGLPWNIVPLEEDDASPSVKKQAQEALKQMKVIAGPTRKFRAFIDMVVEDLLVLDASANYRQRRRNGDFYRLIPIDGSTIRVVVDSSGQLREPPDYAFEQWINGKKVSELTLDDLYYLMMNPRTSTPYGFSPLEALVIVIQSALSSEMANAAMLKEGNIPEGFIQAPETWTPDQIKEYQAYFDALLAGNLRETSRVKFIPGGKGASYIPTKKPDEMKYRDFEEWLTIKTCALFGVSPQSIGITFDINKATAETQATLSANESIKPLADFLSEFLTDVLQNDLGYENLRFVFNGITAEDDAKRADIHSKYLDKGVLDIDEVRKEIGKEPIIGRPSHAILTPSGPIPLDEVFLSPEEKKRQEEQKQQTPPPPPPQQIQQKTPEQQQQAQEEQGAAAKATVVDDLALWQRKALKDVKNGKPFRPFVSDAIDDQLNKAISDDLVDCSTPQEVRAVFQKYIQRDPGHLIRLANSLRKSLEKTQGKGAVKIEKKRRRLILFENFEKKKPAQDFNRLLRNTMDEQIQKVITKEFIDDLQLILGKAAGPDEQRVSAAIRSRFKPMTEFMDVEKVLAFLVWSGEQGGSIAARAIGSDGIFKLTNTNLISQLKDRSTYLIKSLDEATIDDLRDAFLKGVRNQLSQSELQDYLVRRFTNEISPYRAEMITRTEFANAASMVDMETYKRSDVGEWQWSQAPGDEGDECTENDGEIRKIGEPFPSGDDRPPVHPNCKCDVIPIISEEVSSQGAWLGN